MCVCVCVCDFLVCVCPGVEVEEDIQSTVNCFWKNERWCPKMYKKDLNFQESVIFILIKAGLVWTQPRGYQKKIWYSVTFGSELTVIEGVKVTFLYGWHLLLRKKNIKGDRQTTSVEN